jgi:cell cycle sensor histidine kinase DivJ
MLALFAPAVERADLDGAGGEARAARLARFSRSNLVSGVLALALGAGALALAPPEGLKLWLTLAWLATPLFFAYLPKLLPRPVLCQLAALINLAGLVTFLCVLTGGARSFLLPWFVILPVEAAVSGNRRLIAVGVGLAAAGLALNVALGEWGLLPEPLLPVESGGVLTLLGLGGAMIYAAGLALTLENLGSEAEASIRKGEARYRLLAEHAGDLITRHAPDGRIAFASPAAEKLAGQEPFRLIGTYPASIAHPADREEVMFAFLRASRLGEEGLAVWRLVRPDGSTLWVETSCHPAPRVGRRSGEAREIIAVTRDITPRKEAQDALLAARDAAEDANRAKSRFLANMSHELRTPLNAIIGFSDMMRQQMFGTLGEPRYLDYAHHIHDSGRMLLDLINDLLDMAKIEAGKREVKRVRVDPAEAVRAALSVVQPLAEQRGLALAAEVAPGGTVCLDRRALQQILLNLLSNAIKFTPKGGRVALCVTRSADAVTFAVADTGIGIAPEDLERLGRPFEQIDGDYSRQNQGTGLGLALVKALAELHGGGMTIESAPGRGTCVTVKLGLADEEAALFQGAA